MTIQIDKGEFISFINKGFTIKQLSEYYNCSIRVINDRKNKWSLTKTWTEKDLTNLIEYAKLGYTSTIIATKLGRTTKSILNMASLKNIKLLGNNPKDNNLFKKQVKDKVIVLEKYINSTTHIKCQCIKCMCIRKPKPNDLIQGTGCPICAINPAIPKYTYLLYFNTLDLYKIGITNNIPNRRSQLGIKSEVIFSRYFDNGQDAYKLEQKWLENIKLLKVNTSKLRSGNTETFKYE